LTSVKFDGNLLMVDRSTLRRLPFLYAGY